MGKFWAYIWREYYHIPQICHFFDTSYSKLDTRWCAGDNHEVCIIKWENVGPISGGEITGKYWADFREEGKFLDI